MKQMSYHSSCGLCFHLLDVFRISRFSIFLPKLPAVVGSPGGCTGSETSTAAVGGAREVLTPATPACLRWASESRSALAASGSNGLQLAVSSS